MSTRTDVARRAGVALLGVVCAVLALAVPAHADPQPVGVGYARTDDQQRGLFHVAAWTDATGAAVSAVTAAVRDSDDVVTTLTLTGANGIWSPAQPLELTEDGGVMPHLGRYAIDVTVTDDQGNTVTRTGAGTLDFTLQPQFKAMSNDSALGFTQPTLTATKRATAVTGVLLGVQPGSGDLVPIAGAVVHIQRRYNYDMPARAADLSTTATTGSTGRFTSGSFTQQWGATYLADFSADDDQVHGVANTAYGIPDIRTTAVRIHAAPNHTQLSADQTLTVSGTVRAGASASAPVVSGARLTVVLDSNQLSPRRVVTTSAGHFSASIVAVASYYPRWSVSLDDAFYTAAPVGGDVRIAAEASYYAHQISLSGSGLLVVHATLGRTYDHVTTVYGTQLTHLQYSANGRTNWHTIGTGRSTYDPFTMSVEADHADGYYRLQHPATAELAATTTSAVHLHRLITRIDANTATPTSVAAGAVVTVRGALQVYNRGWHAMGANRISLYFRLPGSKHYRYVTSGRSDSRGRVTLRGRAAKAGYWLLQYFGDKAHFDSFALPALVKVR